MKARIAQRTVSNLVRQAWARTARQRNLSPFALASGASCWFLTNGQLEGNKTHFIDREGKRRVETLVGYSQKRSVFWHFAAELRPLPNHPEILAINTPDRIMDGGAANPDWNVNDHLSRLVKIVSHSEIVRPSTEETAMHHAYGAALRSACLSRQVGAALVDSTGNVVATGTNEVPRAGGDVYGETFDTDHTDHIDDHRCAYRKLNGAEPFCSSTREQNSLIERFIEEIPELKATDGMRKQKLAQELRSSGVGDLLEFSRTVHAEMDALLSAGREGITTVGCRLFVTTYPCHNCARHIVSAGVDEGSVYRTLKFHSLHPPPPRKRRGLTGLAPF